jgi:hypothetical protein
MRRFHVSNVLLIALFLFLALAGASAVEPDPRLLSLVPPDAQIVAGMNAPSGGGQPNSFLLITHSNTMDLEAFLALSGADSSRIIQQVIFVARVDHTGKLGEHSLLIGGHFDQAHIFKAAVENGASISEYKGARVLVLQPLERERGSSKDMRWLAITGLNVALFGTIASVQQELDRHLAYSVADPSLMQKLARLRRDDETWCVLSALPQNTDIRNALDALEPTLGELIPAGGGFEFGIHYGRHVEFEYESTGVSAAASEAISNSLVKSLAGPERKGSTSLPQLPMDSNRGPAHGVVKLSKSQYDAWLADVSARRARIAAAAR